jgi:DNA invertase Pin-like site-specific DNA recombinase
MAEARMNTDRIQPRHLDRLAVVYIRQSSMQQVHRNQESTRLQYSLVQTAQHLGWSEDRVLTFDDDLGKSGSSAEGRLGFQRLLSEVALDHVGLVVGLEMSRLARSNRDWHQLLELCARFGTLIADLDGLYDPSHYNDRLLLGLKGTMSEAELHILRQRLLQGKLEKAKRGELGKTVPSGYLRRPSGEIILDPDEEVQAVIRHIFDQFDEIGTVHGLLRELVQKGVQVGVRLRNLDRLGELEWRRPQRGMLMDMLRNPIYAGAYVYGRRQTDPRRKNPARPASGRTPLVSQDEWLVCLKDRLPAYISWDRYEENQIRLDRNRSSNSTPGAARNGPALLQGLLVCGNCRRRMTVQYTKKGSSTWARYVCNQERAHYGGPTCQGLSARCVDNEVSRLILKAIEPAALEVSLSASREIERERKKLDELWQKRLQRARYEAERAARQYHAAEPENRLVTRTLEKAWEDKLSAERQLKEEYRRFQKERPRGLAREERQLIQALATDLPQVWFAATTSNRDRKAIVRQLVNRVEVRVQGDTEWADVKIVWAGDYETERRIRRPVSKLNQLSNHQALIERIGTLRREGYTADQIAEDLNTVGWTTPLQRSPFNGRLIRAMVDRYGLVSIPRGPRRPPGDNPDEWWLTDLAAELNIPRMTLYGWLRRGLLRARELEDPRAGGKWVIFADARERRRLRALRERWPSQSESKKRSAAKDSRRAEASKSRRDHRP